MAGRSLPLMWSGFFFMFCYSFKLLINISNYNNAWSERVYMEQRWCRWWSRLNCSPQPTLFIRKHFSRLSAICVWIFGKSIDQEFYLLHFSMHHRLIVKSTSNVKRIESHNTKFELFSDQENRLNRVIEILQLRPKCACEWMNNPLDESFTYSICNLIAYLLLGGVWMHWRLCVIHYFSNLSSFEQ